MLKVTPISDIAYLVESANDAPTAVAYYTDAKSEPPAVWWCPGSWIAKDGGRPRHFPLQGYRRGAIQRVAGKSLREKVTRKEPRSI